jgi:hypothetical protein
MVEIISYKMCAVKVRNAKLRNYLKSLAQYHSNTDLSAKQLNIPVISWFQKILLRSVVLIYPDNVRALLIK